MARMPSGTQFLDASFFLMSARDEARQAFLLTGTGLNVDSCAVQCIEKMKAAAEALGFEMIQRVTPATRDGGRMDLAEIADA